MRIAMVSEHASPLAVLGGVDAGGQNVHVAGLACALARRGVDVVVHTRRDDPSLPREVPFAPGVVIDHVSAGPPEPMPKDELLPTMEEFANDLSNRWALDRPDVVHSHFWMSGLASLAAAHPLGIPVAHTYHALGVVKRRHQGSGDTSPPARIMSERRIARCAELVVATTRDERAEVIRMGGRIDRISVVPCGVDLDRFTPQGSRRDRGERSRVVVVSRLVARKGIGNVIAALTLLPDVDLVIAGGPPAALVEDEPEAQRFLSLARQLGVGHRVELLGAVGRDDVPALLRSADVVACCPWYEPFGLVAVEAMASGVPVVASAVGGLAETVLDGVTGLHVAPRRPREIAQATEWLLDHPARARAMGEAGARRARRYGWDRIAGETLDVAQRLARRPSRQVMRS